MPKVFGLPNFRAHARSIATASKQEIGMGSERVRPPRLPLIGRERDEARAVFAEAMAHKPRR